MSLVDHEARRIRQALELVESIANERQGMLNLETGPGALSCPADQIRHLLSYSRTIDTLERIATELAGLLNKPSLEIAERIT